MKTRKTRKERFPTKTRLGLKAPVGHIKATDIPSTLQLEGICEVLAAEAAAEGKQAGPAKFNLLANTGTPMRLNGFYDPVIVVLAGAKFAQNKTPVIADHDTRLRIGHTTSQTVEATKIVAEGIVSSSSGIAQGFVNDARAGFPFQVSIGAKILKAHFLPEGQKEIVNGKEYAGPLIVAEKTRIRELSILVLGADGATSAKLAATLKGSQMNEFEKWVEGLGLVVAELSEEAKSRLKATYEDLQLKATRKKVKGKKVPVGGDHEEEEEEEDLDASEEEEETEEDSLDSHRQRIAAEEDRTDRIREILAREDFSSVEEVSYEPTPGAKLKTVSVNTFKKTAIKAGWTPERVELHMMRAAMPQAGDFGPGPGIHSKTRFQTENYANAATIALLRQYDVKASAVTKTGKKYGLEVWFTEKELEAADAPQFKNYSLHALLDHTIRAAGLYFEGNRKSDDYIRTAVRANQVLRASPGAGPFSTLGVSNILENVGNKFLLSSYEAQATVWDQFAGVRNLQDFKTHSYYRLGVHGGYQKIGATGELGHGEFTDQKFTLTAETYGMIIGISRQHLINDDLSSFEEITKAMGREAALALEEAVFKLLLSTTIFNATDIAVDVGLAGYSAALLAFRNSVDAKGRPILVNPDRVLVGTADEITALQLYRDLNLIAVGQGNAAALGFNSNPHQNRFRPFSSPYMNNTAIRGQDGKAITGQDADAWFMFADPAVLAAIVVGFLNGNRTPTLQSADTSFDTLGVQYRSYHDWGVGEGDPAAAIKSTGG
jgi:hypothetical protein